MILLLALAGIAINFSDDQKKIDAAPASNLRSGVGLRGPRPIPQGQLGNVFETDMCV
jgi:hypothetical protein